MLAESGLCKKGERGRQITAGRDGFALYENESCAPFSLPTDRPHAVGGHFSFGPTFSF